MSAASAKHGGALVDAHTPLHAIVGFIAGVAGIDPHLAMATFIGARIVESALRDGTHSALFGEGHAQSLGNEMADLLFEVGGLHVGEALRHKFIGSPVQPAAGLGFAHYLTLPNGTKVLRR